MEIMLQGLKNPYNELIPLRIEKKIYSKRNEVKKKMKGGYLFGRSEKKPGPKINEIK